MRIVFLSLFFLSPFLYAVGIDTLLKEYEQSSKNSLSTLNEKMGHVVVYTQHELQMMQYDSLVDLLRELPNTNVNTNSNGMSTMSLSGSKTDVSGFFRLYINDHEVSSIYDQSLFLGWIEMPIALIDHVEVYYGEGSFTLGSETGVQFIRVYTKDAKKENGNEINLSLSNKDSNTQNFTHSSFLKNGWSYLLHASKQSSQKEQGYQNDTIKNDSKRGYLFFNLKNSHHSIDFGYTDVKKDTYLGYSTDFLSNQGEIKARSAFLHVNSYLLDDKSLKTSFSVDINEKEYFEKNDEGLFIPSIIDLTNIPGTMPKEYNEKVKLLKVNGRISKKSHINGHEIYGAVNFKNKRYKTKKRESVNFADITINQADLNDFNKESISSFIFQDNYKFNDKLYLIGNLKIDHYERSSTLLKDETEYLYRVGSIYLPSENFGIKSFYTRSYIPPSFYNIDFADKSNPKIKTQQYKYFTLGGVYTFGNSKFNATYFDVKIEDFVYYTQIGFINIFEDVKTSGFIFDYEYKVDNKHKIKLNYYTSELNQAVNNSNKGGYIKYMGHYKKWDYFSALVFKNAYEYLGIEVDDSYNLNLGVTYKHSHNLRFSLKGKNLLEKPTKTLVPGASVAFEDYDRSVVFGFRWLF